ncbi:MAG: hypothetical protein AABY44_09190 [Nitrospirota bacterium]
MFKKTGGMNHMVHTTGYIAALIVISLLSGCSGCSKQSNSVTGPTEPAPGFEISNLRFSISHNNVYSYVDYKGADGGIEAMYVRGGDGNCMNWTRFQNLAVKNTSQTGTYNSGGCYFSKDGIIEVYLKDNNQRDSNLLSSVVTNPSQNRSQPM